MIVYVSTIIFLAILAFIEEYVKLSIFQKSILKFCAYLILVLQVGFRWETGTDWNAYLSHFESIEGLNSTSPFTTGFEYGYNLFVWFIKLFSSSYTFFLLLHALIYYFLVFKSFNFFSKNISLSLMLFYALFMGVMGSNRQLLGLAICMVSLIYLFQDKKYKFFILVFVATLFHTSSLIFVVFFFLKKKLKPSILFLLLLISFYIGQSGLSTIIFSSLGNVIGGVSADKTSAYIEFANSNIHDEKLSMFGIIKRIILLTLFFCFRNKLSEKVPYYNLLFNGYFVGILFYILFSKSLLIMISRGSVFFNIMEAFLLVSLIILFEKKYRAYYFVILTVVSFIYLIQSISSYSDLFLPYKGLFINSEYQRNMY
jgi:hypothetical protein